MKKVTFDLDDGCFGKLEKDSLKNQRTLSGQIRYIIQEYYK